MESLDLKSYDKLRERRGLNAVSNRDKASPKFFCCTCGKDDIARQPQSKSPRSKDLDELREMLDEFRDDLDEVDALFILRKCIKRAWASTAIKSISICGNAIPFLDCAGEGTTALQHRELNEPTLGDPPEFSDDFLLQCLKIRRSPSAALANALAFVRLRRFLQWPLQFRARDVSMALQCECYKLLPKPDRLGRAILVVTCNSFRRASILNEEFQKGVSYLIQEACKQPHIHNAGIIVVVDAGGVSFSDFFGSFDGSEVRRMAASLHCTPCRVKRTLIINAPMYVVTTWNVILQFMKPKAQERVVFVESNKGLVDELGADALPPDLGGNLRFCWKSWVNQKLREEEEDKKEEEKKKTCSSES